MTTTIRVLYAEDNPQDADQTLQHFAQNAPDFEFEIVPTAEQFLDRAAGRSFDLLLLDNHLPDQDGTDVLKALNRAGSHCPVVLVTGVGDDAVVLHSLRLGASDYVSKRTGYLAEMPAVLRAAVANPCSHTAASKPRRVLYVEHHATHIDLTIQHLGEVAPYLSVEVAGSAEQALELLSGPHRFDLVLCDLHMGGMSAIDLLRELKRLPGHPPFIVTTAQGDEDTAIAAMKLGAYDYLIKREGHLNQLPFIIENAIDRAELQRAQAQLEAELAAAALRESEDRYRLLVERLPEGIMVYCDHRIVFANPAAVGLFGASTQQELSSHSLSDLLAPESAHWIAATLQQATGASVQTTELTLRRLDGRSAIAEVTSSPFTHEGRPALQVVCRDITERRASERAAHHSQRLEAIGTLASGIAHDLNNALAPILMGVGLLRRKYPQDSKSVDLIEGGVSRSAAMVQHLMTFARGAEGQRVSVHLERLIQEMAGIIQGTFSKNITLEIDLEPELPTVLGDATQLHQILLNLCVNARDAMPEGGTLTLGARRVEMDTAFASGIVDAKPGCYVALQVSDTGTGIPPDLLDRIFDPFFTTKRPELGTGLGLSNVLGLVRGHGGCIQVRSEPRQGAHFTIYLPVDGDTPQPAPTTDRRTALRGKGALILFVDDEAPVRQVAVEILEGLSYKVVVAADGSEALIRAAEHRMELCAVITDVMMPHLDGLALARALRRMLPGIPIGVISGRMDDLMVRQFDALGVTTRLDKPFTEGQLAETLRELLRVK